MARTLNNCARKARLNAKIAEFSIRSEYRASKNDGIVRSQSDLLMLAAVCSEALLESNETLKVAEQLRAGRSNTLATFLNG